MNNEWIKLLSLCFDKSPEEAVKFLKSQGIKITWDWEKQIEAIREHCFTVAKITTASVIQDVFDGIQSAMEEGKSYQEFKKDISRVLNTSGFTTREDGSAWRLDTIYRTNMQSAYMAGRYQQMKAVENDFPYWELVAIIDHRTTSGCSALNGTVRPANDPFWKTNYPPRHYNCRDRVNALTREQAMKLGITDPKQTANVQPAEGFDTIPGQYQPDLSKYDPAIQKAILNER